MKTKIFFILTLLSFVSLTLCAQGDYQLPQGRYFTGYQWHYPEYSILDVNGGCLVVRPNQKPVLMQRPILCTEAIPWYVKQSSGYALRLVLRNEGSVAWYVTSPYGGFYINHSGHCEPASLNYYDCYSYPIKEMSYVTFKEWFFYNPKRRPPLFIDALVRVEHQSNPKRRNPSAGEYWRTTRDALLLIDRIF